MINDLLTESLYSLLFALHRLSRIPLFYKKCFSNESHTPELSAGLTTHGLLDLWAPLPDTAFGVSPENGRF